MAGQAHDEMALDELTDGQRRVLLTVAGSELASHLYLTGGTALRAAYLHHRTSVDLEFFSRGRIPTESVLALIRGAGMAVMDSSRLHDRWDMTLLVESERVRTAFVHYAFDRVAASTVRIGALDVDSFRDIFANKLSAVVDRFEAKDYADILLMLRAGASLDQGIADATAKFGWGQLPVLLQQAFARAGRLTAWPDLTPRVTLAEAQVEFQRLARSLIGLPDEA